MKQIGAVLLAVAFLVCLGLLSCVPKKIQLDAHITVDIRQHIEKQADSTLDFIEGKTNALPGADQPPKPKKTSALERAWGALSPISVAYAAELKEKSPEITQIAEQLRERNQEVEALKQKGFVGENNRGHIEVRPSDRLTDPAERNQVQRVVAAENKDRKALYNEIAKLNRDQRVSVSAVESIYAVKRLQRAKPGDIVQLPPAGADFNAFKVSAPGQQLGAACVPEAWVTLK